MGYYTDFSPIAIFGKRGEGVVNVQFAREGGEGERGDPEGSARGV